MECKRTNRSDASHARHLAVSLVKTRVACGEVRPIIQFVRSALCRAPTAQPFALQFQRSIRDAGGRCRLPTERRDAAAARRGSPRDTAAAPPAVGTEAREAAGLPPAAQQP